MIVTRIFGGLGNQMFQYAYGQYLAEKNNTEHLLDYAGLENDPLRNYMLNRFSIDARAATNDLRGLFPRRYGGNGWRNILAGRRPLRRIHEKPFGFHAKYLAVGDHVYLRGYWQNERFFPGQRQRLLEQFRPTRSINPTTRAVARQIERAASVSLHVRRGDYVQNASVPLCSLGYYQRCAEAILERHERLSFFVFSDDIAWCRQHFRFGCPTSYVGHNAASSAHEDIWLMSRCRHHIIANSTFSWWGAWLRQNEEGQVYAPLQWFQDPSLNAKWQLPANWQRIDDVEMLEKAA